MHSSSKHFCWLKDISVWLSKCWETNWYKIKQWKLSLITIQNKRFPVVYFKNWIMILISNRFGRFHCPDESILTYLSSMKYVNSSCKRRMLNRGKAINLAFVQHLFIYLREHFFFSFRFPPLFLILSLFLEDTKASFRFIC